MTQPKPDAGLRFELRDGRVAWVRPMRPDDKARLSAAMSGWTTSRCSGC